MARLLLKIIFIIVLLTMSVRLYQTAERWVFISNVNLIFHEAGHVIFAPFGHFVSVLGGTLGELLIPLAIMFYFLNQGNRFAFGFSVWWLSTALYSVSIYAADAEARLLPLITGDAGTHDWWYLLSSLGWLTHADTIGTVLFVGSFSMFVLALMVFSKDLKSEWTT